MKNGQRTRSASPGGKHGTNNEYLLINWLKSLTNQPRLSRLVWRLRLAATLRKFYYFLNRPHDDVMRVELGGLTASFYVRTPWELRSLESAGGLGREKHVLEVVLDKICPGDVVYDIGSNFGIYTVLLAKAIGPNGLVVAIEPEPRAYERLQENLNLNGLTNVRAFRLALGDRCGQARLYLGEVTGASRLMEPRGAPGSYELVTVMEGDRIVEEEKLPPPRLVKIDVEGHEHAVIQGLRQTLAKPGCKMVCCEIHPQLLPAGLGPEGISDSLRSLGFSRVEVYSRGTTEYHALAHKP